MKNTQADANQVGIFTFLLANRTNLEKENCCGMMNCELGVTLWTGSVSSHSQLSTGMYGGACTLDNIFDYQFMAVSKTMMKLLFQLH